MVAGAFTDATLEGFFAGPFSGTVADGATFAGGTTANGSGGSQEAIRLITTLAILSAETTASPPTLWHTTLNAA